MSAIVINSGKTVECVKYSTGAGKAAFCLLWLVLLVGCGGNRDLGDGLLISRSEVKSAPTGWGYDRRIAFPDIRAESAQTFTFQLIDPPRDWYSVSLVYTDAWLEYWLKPGVVTVQIFDNGDPQTPLIDARGERWRSVYSIGVPAGTYERSFTSDWVLLEPHKRYSLEITIHEPIARPAGSMTPVLSSLSARWWQKKTRTGISPRWPSSNDALHAKNTNGS